MLAPAHRGRIVAVEVLMLSLTSFDIKRLLIAVKTTRFDDGHFIAWCIEQNGTHSCWPTRVRLDPSLLRSDAGHTESGMRVIYRKSLDMGPKHMCLDELELICLRAPLPDLELGEDQCSWCLDVLLKLERLQCLAFGEEVPFRRQFNDINSFERALLHTNTTANAKRFTDKGNFA